MRANATAAGKAAGWRHVQGGLGGVAARYGAENSIQRVNEERARQYAMLTEEEKSMPIDAPLTDDLDLSNTDMASMDQPIPGSNIGFRMLQKLGWKAGSGLGRRQQGIIDPIRFDVKEEVLGVGAESHYREMSKMTTSERKRLESESQLNETPEQAAVREAKAEQRRRQDQNVQDELSNLRCTLCNKQYTKAIEYQAHLDSYDHNHRKRFADMRRDHRVESGATSAAAAEDRMLAKRIAAAAKAEPSAPAPAPKALEQNDERPVLKFSFKAKPKAKRR
ncbi:G-patch domain-containing protein [Plasmodiophora brassicae]|uniref:G-patch domain-containing protein n=1 Tax=Plasmodiophora brassicae TaxID=37360 RepID=A0A0G4IP49_PLABS|nr:hypothetical protein PBRA_005561 [Plasmodiophora brassicae]SPR01909.1 unnamed protein product [Plasmodiophora brassicae]